MDPWPKVIFDYQRHMQDNAALMAVYKVVISESIGRTKSATYKYKW